MRFKKNIRMAGMIGFIIWCVSVNGCHRQNPYAPDSTPKAPKVMIRYPKEEFEYQRIVGDGTMMDIEGYIGGVDKQWPPRNFDRVEIYVEGRLDGVLYPEDVGKEAIQYGWPPYVWFFRYTIRRFQKGPKRSVLVEVRSVRGNDTKRATIELLYDNERVHELAYERVLRIGCSPGKTFPRMASRRIYWTTEYQDSYKLEATRDALNFMAEHLGLEFIHTQDRSRRPIIIFLKNRCCGCCGSYSYNDFNDSGMLVAYVAADSGVINSYGYATTVCHEVGHAIGLPHDDAGSCMDDSDSDDNRMGLRLWPYQQYAVRKMYDVPIPLCDYFL